MTQSDERPAFDRAGMLDRLGGDEDLLLEIVAMFRDEAGPLIESVRAAVADGDADRARRAAHTIRGALLNVGATGAGDVAAQVERAAAAGDVEAAREALRHLDAELDRLQSELRAG